MRGMRPNAELRPGSVRTGPALSLSNRQKLSPPSVRATSWACLVHMAWQGMAFLHQSSVLTASEQNNTKVLPRTFLRLAALPQTRQTKQTVSGKIVLWGSCGGGPQQIKPGGPSCCGQRVHGKKKPKSSLLRRMEWRAAWHETDGFCAHQTNWGAYRHPPSCAYLPCVCVCVCRTRTRGVRG